MAEHITTQEGQSIIDLEARGEKIILRARDFSMSYGKEVIFQNLNIDIAQGKITAVMGPSGAGKSTLIRGFNRLHEIYDGNKVSGSVWFGGVNLYDKKVDPVEVRRRIGMVFQKANPFPKSIYENVAWGARINGFKGNMDEHVEESLKKAALWNEVKDRLKESGLSLSGGQQQRLCIARAIAVEPDILLMDEPCSALDARSTAIIEELMKELRKKGQTIIIVTHNKGQSFRVGDYLVFINNLSSTEEDKKVLPRIVEYGVAEEMAVNPKMTETQDFLSERFG